MDNLLYSILYNYYHLLELTGSVSSSNTKKLLVISFYNDFIYNYCSDKISREDYLLIEKALDCMYGSSCLIPYPDYLRMGKLQLNEVTKLALRVKAIEDTNVVKVMHNLEDVSDDSSDVSIMESDDSN